MSKKTRDYMDLLNLASSSFPLTKKIEDYDEAIIGLSIRIGEITNFIYSLNKILQLLMERHSMTYDQAIEFYVENIAILHDETDLMSPMIFDDRPHFSLN